MSPSSYNLRNCCVYAHNSQILTIFKDCNLKKLFGNHNLVVNLGQACAKKNCDVFFISTSRQCFQMGTYPWLGILPGDFFLQLIAFINYIINENPCKFQPLNLTPSGSDSSFCMTSRQCSQMRTYPSLGKLLRDFLIIKKMY